MSRLSNDETEMIQGFVWAFLFLMDRLYFFFSLQIITDFTFTDLSWFSFLSFSVMLLSLALVVWDSRMTLRQHHSKSIIKQLLVVQHSFSLCIKNVLNTGDTYTWVRRLSNFVYPFLQIWKHVISFGWELARAHFEQSWAPAAVFISTSWIPACLCIFRNICKMQNLCQGFETWFDVYSPQRSSCCLCWCK